jgi:ArsR family transcriptional regulator
VITAGTVPSRPAGLPLAGRRVQLGQEPADPAVDLVADPTDLLDGLAGGVLELPVLIALARVDRAGVDLLATSPEPVCVCEFTGPLGLSQPTVSHHLKKLVLAGLLDREQRGTWAYYWLRPDALGGLAAALDLRGGSR